MATEADYSIIQGDLALPVAFFAWGISPATSRNFASTCKLLRVTVCTETEKMEKERIKETFRQRAKVGLRVYTPADIARYFFMPASPDTVLSMDIEIYNPYYMVTKSTDINRRFDSPLDRTNCIDEAATIYKFLPYLGTTLPTYNLGDCYKDCRIVRGTQARNVDSMGYLSYHQFHILTRWDYNIRELGLVVRRPHLTVERTVVTINNANSQHIYWIEFSRGAREWLIRFFTKEDLSVNGK